MSLNTLRSEIAANKHTAEQTFVQGLLDQTKLNVGQRENIERSARHLVGRCREDTRSQTLLDSFLQEFGLSNKEGVALMCLAEALLRVPDKITADRLIAEKIASGDWTSHSGNSESIFVNGATWGMILTGKMIRLDPEITDQPGSWVKDLSSKVSEPVVRRAILQSMRIMGGQYVLGRSIDEGMHKGQQQNPESTRYSFDMLGEGARTMADAGRYYQAYSNSFDEIGKVNDKDDVITADGISVKLSALHPQYHFAHYDTVMAELLPKITALCLKAKRYNIGLSIDAEEAARLDMSLDIFEVLCRDPQLSGWNGLGFVLQAYQKRAPLVAQWLCELAQETERGLMVRLVKGAYWDAEIKHAQEQGLEDYPVFTRKANTDVCYLHCANILLSAGQPIFPQFATHNAYTTVAVIELASSLENPRFEFQRLHGMGELLYKHLLSHHAEQGLALRIYAPIGEHEDLLPYLVRRLLENGANSSFVNRFLDDDTPIDELIVDLYDDVTSHSSFRHSKIPLPSDLFTSVNEARANSVGIDLDSAEAVQKISQSTQAILQKNLEAHSIVGGQAARGQAITVDNPANFDQAAGQSSYASSESVEQALALADQAFPAWNTLGPAARADMLDKAADLLEEHMHELIGIVSREAGRTIADCVSEVREAVDFCRYYGLQARHSQSGADGLSGRGTFFCVSPWNFPLAIFVGQISAALAAGNCVIAKPAEQTPLVAARVVELLHQAGCPVNVLHLLLGEGAVIGQQVIGDPRISGVVFTGSTETATLINKQIAKRSGSSIPLIAETGGQNCMVVDSTALPEQVVDDVISSAFHSAGQRCSALRVLYLQEEIADKVMTMLEGAMQAVIVGDPSMLSTDIGPVIDQRAIAGLLAHVKKFEASAKQTLAMPVKQELLLQGNYFQPRVFEIGSISELSREVFGPVLHVIRYHARDLEKVIAEINSTGYGLTLGVHSRIEAIANMIYRKTNVGNTYVNRSTIGAVVGVNPFGGAGLSGTGPKAGGPHYITRFQNFVYNGETDSGNASAVREFAQNKMQEVIEYPGPTGEQNLGELKPKGVIGFIVPESANVELSPLIELALACGNQVKLLTDSAESQSRASSISSNLIDNSKVECLSADQQSMLVGLTALVCEAGSSERQSLRVALADSAGPITPLIEYAGGLDSINRLKTYFAYFVSERIKTDNLVARGGNTQLFNLEE
ncbi:MAG: RHH-type proline utilization regulon transcriptional repressor/proline dehydrogenase [Cryomorphaceae bacterium]|jgi:RHH-type proline utilization regulon transcriptional repressor/proline dehydrogenase/delta 1-pyrroline-5-carboxylate dehydrogenase